MPRVLMAGSGGEGILSMGQLLAYAGMIENKEVSWMPSYGPEMRGGTANCSVIISKEKIASPIVSRPDILVTLNFESFKKFVPKVVQGGCIFIHEKILDKELEEYITDKEIDQLDIIRIFAKTGAKSLEDERFANTIMLGALSDKTNIVSIDSLKTAVERVFGRKNKSLIEKNKKALDNGAKIASMASVK